MKYLILKAKLRLCFLFLMTFCIAILNAQHSHTLYGVILDNNQKPLPYAVVSDSKNVNSADTTDFDGKFLLETNYKINTVKVSFPGVESKIQLAEYDEMTIILSFPISDSLKINQAGRGVVVPIQIPQAPIVPLSQVRIVSRRFMQNPLGSSVFPISEIGSKEIESTNGFSMQDALNMIPGVQMDSRGYNGSRRLNLRGTIARSPFGVRNVRLNLNGFPLTSSDGSSALELLEPSEISVINLSKGPSGSYNMTGTGGVLSSSLKPVYPKNIEGEITYGQFGFFRAKAGVNFGKSNLRSRLSLVHSFNNGYRNQEANNKTQLSLESRLDPSNDKLKYDLLFMLYDGYWELPGHLTLNDALNDPREADPDSEDMNAHVKRRRAYIGIHQRYLINDRVQNSTRVFGQLTDKYNPYGTHPIFFQGIKDENGYDLGVRTEFDIALRKVSKSKLRFKAGTQWQVFGNDLEEFDNNSGEKGDFKYSNQTTITEGLFFLSSEYKPFDKLRATAQLGYNLYSLTNSGVNSEDTSLDFNTGTQSSILPRLGASYKYSKHGQVAASYSQGIGYPSIFEGVDVDTGLFSEGLKPELSSNIEFFATHKFYKTKSETDVKLSVYTGTVQNTIVENANNTEAIFYKNQGESIQQGVEFQGAYTRIRETNNQWGLYSTLAFQDYQLNNDTTDDKLRVPGIPEFRAVVGMNFGLNNWSGNITGTYMSQIATSVGPVTDENTDYILVNAKVGRKFNSNKPWNYVVELGVNNLLNEFYTSFYRLNASGRVYNPMPEINGFVSFKVNFD